MATVCQDCALHPHTMGAMDAGDAMLNALIAGFQSDRDGLFHALIERLDESMLLEIARADYGMDVEPHEDALRIICKDGRISAMSQYPHEVLSLVQWSHPEDPNWGPGGHGERGHIMRAFCCCALLQDDGYGAGGPNQSVAPLIESMLFLGGSLPNLTHPFLVWCLRQTDIEREERAFFVLGLIVLATARRDEPLDQAQISRMIHWLDVEEAAIRNDDYGPIDERCLWGLTCMNISHPIWLRLVQTHLSGSKHPEHAALRQFGERLVAEYSRKRRTKH